MVSIPVERLRNFLEWMVKNENIDFVLPSEFLERSKVERKQYVKAGSWEPDRMVDVWWRDPDNMRLNALCDEARFYLIRGEAPEEGEGWKHLLLAENSDGRGWGPLPERRLDCYFHALKAIEIGKRKKN
jgi:alpha-amylase/alpha-mannosidase (GH57 family)